MNLRLRVLQHALKVLDRAPLRVIGHMSRVEAAMDVCRHEPGLVAHDLDGGAVQERNQLLDAFWLDRERR